MLKSVSYNFSNCKCQSPKWSSHCLTKLSLASNNLIYNCLFWTNINMEIWLRRNKSCCRRQVNPEGRTGQDCSPAPGEQVMVLPVPVPGWWGPRRGSSWSWRCWVREGRCGFDVPDLPSWHKLELEPEERQDYWTENTRKLNVYRLLVLPLALYLDLSHLILLGTRHQDGGLDQQLVTGVQLPPLRLLLRGRLEAGGVPAVLLVTACQAAGPEKCSHYKSENKTSVPELTCKYQSELYY